MTLADIWVYTEVKLYISPTLRWKLKKTAVISLGCPKNQVDSEIITGMLASRYCITADPAEANIIIINTCGFIEDAKAESIETLLEMAELKNNGICEKIYATGCLAQRYGQELLKEIPELDGVLGDGDLDTIPLLLENGSKEKQCTYKKHQDFIYSHEMPRIRLSPPYFAYIKIAEGCNNFCSYCTIPQIKGSYRSRTMESIIEETKRLAAEGVKEIALIAQDTTRYGSDKYGESRLVALLEKLIKVEGIEWIRLLYCYPEAFSDQLIEIIAKESKICNYVDIPLQHADNEILKKMNRRNTAEEAEALIARLRQNIPGIFIRSTFITGFPGETEEQFQKLLDFVQRVKLDRVGVFAYSQEEGTPAAKMSNQIPIKVRGVRKDKLMSLQSDIACNQQQKRIGKILKVILEEEISQQSWVGRTEGDAPEIDGQIYLEVYKKHLPGDIIDARILEADSYDLKGEELK